jgi:hypothetical protein
VAPLPDDLQDRKVEILYELREHSAGLNWDDIFSFIKTFRNDPAFVIPDRVQVTMEQPLVLKGAPAPPLLPVQFPRHGGQAESHPGLLYN